MELLERTTALTPAQARRVAEDVLAVLAEPLEAFVQRRHRELSREGLRNDAIFAAIERELGGRRFRAPERSLRQLRRIVYG